MKFFLILFNMITEYLTGLMFLFYFQFGSITQYLSQYNNISYHLICNNIINKNYYQITRIYTFSFFHENLNHLLLNSIFLMNIGQAIEKKITTKKYLQILFITPVINSICFIGLNYLQYLACNDITYLFITMNGAYNIVATIEYINSYKNYQNHTLVLRSIIFQCLIVNIILKNNLTSSLSGTLGGYVICNLLDL